MVILNDDIVGISIFPAETDASTALSYCVNSVSARRSWSVQMDPYPNPCYQLRID